MKIYDRPNAVGLGAIHFSVILFVLSGDRTELLFPVFFSLLIFYLICDYTYLSLTHKNKESAIVKPVEPFSWQSLLPRYNVANIALSFFAFLSIFMFLTQVKTGSTNSNLIAASAIFLSTLCILFLGRFLLKVSYKNKRFSGSRPKVFAIVFVLGVVSIEIIRSIYLL